NPSTGKTAVWVNKLTTISIEDMEPNASATLIDEVQSHFYDEGLAYSHTWRSGDQILWDNLVLQHARLPFDENSRRTLRRTAIL
ncbi:MAG: TauD/TfdA family dioxygenase, partial [Pseudomonadota bacterium]|nr:TauD/TfdA family dioxygenase [Pseudomonadota bacterium]